MPHAPAARIFRQSRGAHVQESSPSFLTLTIDAIDTGLIIPVLPDLFHELTGEDIGGAALWGGVLTTAFAAMQLLFSPTLGNVSDR